MVNICKYERLVVVLDKRKQDYGIIWKFMKRDKKMSEQRLNSKHRYKKTTTKSLRYKFRQPVGFWLGITILISYKNIVHCMTFLICFDKASMSYQNKEKYADITYINII